MELTITDETLKANLSQAILASIGEAGQKAVIADAIERLTAPVFAKDRFGHTSKDPAPSVIQDLFTNAVHNIARETIHKLLRDDEELATRLHKLLRESLLAMLDDQSSNIGNAMAIAFTAALARAERY